MSQSFTRRLRAASLIAASLCLFAGPANAAEAPTEAPTETSTEPLAGHTIHTDRAETPSVAFPLDGSDRSRLFMLLSHFEQTPSQESLLELDIDLQATLIEIAETANIPDIARGRAVLQLRGMDLAVNQAFVERFLQIQPDANPYLTGRVLRLAGVYLSAEAPEWSLETLKPFLRHPDIGIREWVVEGLFALHAIPSIQTRADEQIMQMAIAERNPGVKSAIRRNMERVPLLRPSSLPQVRRVNHR